MSCAAPKKNVDLQQQTCRYNPTALQKKPDIYKPAPVAENLSEKSSFKPKPLTGTVSKDERPFACQFRGGRPHIPFSLSPNTFEKLCGPTKK